MKSKQRVRDYWEVFTPEWVVYKMLCLVNDNNISTTYLEPACWNGNFLVKILERKLELYNKLDNPNFWDIITIVGSIYWVDILADNVSESIDRMFEMVKPYVKDVLEGQTILDILRKNIQVWNFLATKEKPLVIYRWEAEEFWWIWLSSSKLFKMIDWVIVPYSN